MNSFRDRRCDKLSTGMKQKTSIARTLVHDPPVMIFDEPTLGLDIMAARTIVDFIRECRNAGKTVVLSTHVMSEVRKTLRRDRHHPQRTPYWRKAPRRSFAKNIRSRIWRIFS